ncbi:MAG: orotidine-5'-phosphate decarboxylase [Ignavibacteria bacterium]|nr:orotidine-5'-phosphate decarboxylase [Ignavibacteria bacterium]
MKTAQEKLKSNYEENKHICVGLDPDKLKIPSSLLTSDDPVFQFNKEIIDATKDLALGYKLNFAFFESEGIKGIETLYKTIEYIGDNHFIIGDAKRGDIGNTAEKYAHSLFNEFKVDASTLHPYMGFDSIEPFLNYHEKLNFILVLTSNPGAADFEKVRISNDKFLYQEVLTKVLSWNKHKNLGIVFGATQISELEGNVSSFEGLPVLLPGVGAQGGSLEDVVRLFIKYKNNNFIINSSRGIIYKSNGNDFAEQARIELSKLNQAVAENKI